MAGEFLDPSQWPLWLQSGLAAGTSSPSTMPPSAPGLSGYEQYDPNTLAMMRMKNSAQPAAGRSGEGPDLRSVLGMTPSVGQALGLGDLFGSLIKPANPGTGADVVANPQEAGDLQQRIDKNILKIEQNTKDIKELANKKTNSPPGTQKMSIESMQKENEQLANDNKNYQSRLGLVQSAIDKEASAKKWRETSWGEAYPGFFGAAGVASPIGSYIFGKLPGRKIANTIGAATVGGLGGATEGILAAHAPTYLDMKLPGGPAKEAAEAKNASLDYWLKEIGPIAAVNALVGAQSAYRKNLSLRPDIGSPNLPRPPMPGAGLPGQSTPPSLGLPGAGAPGLSAPPSAPPMGMPGTMSAPSTLPAAAPLPSPSPTLMLPQPRTPPRLIQETEHGLRDIRTGRFTSETPTLGLDAPPFLAGGGPPAPANGYVRFYHGGENPGSGGGRWVTPDLEYARNFRSMGEPNTVHYVDVKKGSPAEISARQWDAIDEQARTNMVGRYGAVELPEEYAKMMKLYKP